MILSPASKETLRKLPLWFYNMPENDGYSIPAKMEVKHTLALQNLPSLRSLELRMVRHSPTEHLQPVRP